MGSTEITWMFLPFHYQRVLFTNAGWSTSKGFRTRFNAAAQELTQFIASVCAVLPGACIIIPIFRLFQKWWTWSACLVYKISQSNLALVFTCIVVTAHETAERNCSVSIPRRTNPSHRILWEGYPTVTHIFQQIKRSKNLGTERKLCVVIFKALCSLFLFYSWHTCLPVFLIAPSVIICMI